MVMSTNSRDTPPETCNQTHTQQHTPTYTHNMCTNRTFTNKYNDTPLHTHPHTPKTHTQNHTPPTVLTHIDTHPHVRTVKHTHCQTHIPAPIYPRLNILNAAQNTHVDREATKQYCTSRAKTKPHWVLFFSNWIAV